MGTAAEGACQEVPESLPPEQCSVSFMLRPGRIWSPELLFFHLEKLLISSSPKGCTGSYSAQQQMRYLKDIKSS